MDQEPRNVPKSPNTQQQDSLQQLLTFAKEEGLSSKDLQEASQLLSSQQSQEALSQVVTDLKQKYPDGTIYSPQQGFVRVQREDGKYNFFDKDQNLLSKEWFSEAKDFELLDDGQILAPVWVDSKSGNFTSMELRQITPDGSFIESFRPKLITREKASEKEKQTEETFSEIVKTEQQYWGDKLGNNTIEMALLPDKITPELLEKAKEMGFSLFGIPDLRKYIREEDLKSMTVPEFLDNIERQLPGYHHYESLTNDQKKDYSVWRNLKKSFWEKVKAGKTAFPDFSGRWLLVETIPKPKYGNEYPPSKITDELGLEGRFDIPWCDINEAINSNEKNILSVIGLSTTNSKVRILEAVEWNLLANRQGWGETNTYEWTNTECDDINGPYCFIVGDSDGGGAAVARYGHPNLSSVLLGFRLAIDF